MLASVAIEVPVNTPSNVSKLDPVVLIVAGPLNGAVQLHQTLFQTISPAIVGSLASLVALAFRPVVEIEPLATRAIRFAKVSLSGGGAAAHAVSEVASRAQ